MGYSPLTPESINHYLPIQASPILSDLQLGPLTEKAHMHYYQTTPYMRQPHERRTPDMYSRSRQNQPKQQYYHQSDYEDIYSEKYAQNSQNIYSPYNTSVNPLLTSTYLATFTPLNYFPSQNMHRKSPTVIPRPHSADFLEYEVKYPKKPRPKSSLDICAPNVDNYFYSEQRYAEKMRKSAQFLSKINNTNMQNNQHKIQDDKLLQLEYNSMPITRNINTQSLNLSKSNLSKSINLPQPIAQSINITKPVNIPQNINLQYKQEEYSIRRRSASSSSSYEELNISKIKIEDKSPIWTPNNKPRNKSLEELSLGKNNLMQYVTTPTIDSRSLNIEGYRKREESMKRLLEWKQKMLQSPLNKKNTGSRMYSTPEGYFSENIDNSYEIYEAKQHSTPLSMAQYNSYSSDDEGNSI